VRVYGVVGWKNTGKTGLMERLVAEITRRGLAVSTVKHAHHGVDVDQPGRDSHRHREAGAHEVLLASRRRWALMHELRGAPEPALDDLLSRLSPVDLVLVEGYKAARHPKLETHRHAADKPLRALTDPTVRAVASDTAHEGLQVPRLDLDDTVAIADFILRAVGLLHVAAAPDELAPPIAPPRLRDDCFALPRGIHWTPVDDALAHLRRNLSPVVGVETLDVSAALGRVLAEDVMARRSNPPAPNSAVDGYGFAHAATGEGPQTLPLVPGRAAAGVPFPDRVPHGAAIRILTGAILPDGVDTVVLEEDTASDGARIAFHGPVKPRANTRRAGEDINAGEVALPDGHRLRPPDLALLSAVGATRVSVHRRLRMGVLSTGDEIATDTGGPLLDAARIYDANRPMLLAMAERWDYLPVDLGHVGDDRAALAATLDRGADVADVIFTSGGASAGDEDHVSALLGAEGAIASWRIAIKPGRPLALGLWKGVPIFGLPGNPVAAFVCTVIFGRPALSVLAGGPWEAPASYTVPAAFEKNKRPGRREYLRARLTDDGRAEVFPSEGSGRISGLAWATGLVELEDGARRIAPGDPVSFLPYGSFGL
jgi:molybdopterin molybdotransferase